MQSSQFTSEEVKKGYAIYTPKTLKLYDLFVTHFSNRFAWRCPAKQQLAHFNHHITDNHLDVGPGTGYYLDKCRFSSDTPRIVLLDPNKTCLALAETTLAHYQPTVVHESVLTPIQTLMEKFDSISLNYLFHCLPKTFEEKSVVFEHLLPLLNPNGVIFGATILNTPDANWLAKKLMKIYNEKGIFSNQNDSLDKLDSMLRRRFTSVSIETRGCVALFQASQPIQTE